jgi:ABC-type nitrate/sulfonate/bicarbonate transport system substrate-binding protein
MKRPVCTAQVLALATLIATSGALAADKLTVAIGQREIWHGAPASLGARAGIFQKHGLELEILYTEGAGQTMQPVISGNIDVGVAIGTFGVFGATRRARRSASSARNRRARTPIGTCARIPR